MVIAYRVKYLPDGLYFCPSREIRNPNGKGYVRSNLSKNGKMYIRIPSFSWYESIYHPDDQQPYSRPITRKTKKSDWEVEEIWT